MLNYQQAFGKVLRSLRIKHKISQEELSNRSTLDRTYISMLERGVHQPTLGSLIALSQSFQLKASSLVAMMELELMHTEQSGGRMTTPLNARVVRRKHSSRVKEHSSSHTSDHPNM